MIRLGLQFFAHKKGVGSTKNGRDSESKRLGVKKADGQAVIPGNILKVNVTAGQAVKEGDVLVVLEAMKMENEIMAPKTGTVAQVLVSKGSTVNTGDTMVVLN